MSIADLIQWVALPIGLGLFGFIEPCSLGSTLVFIKVLEGRTGADKLAQTCVFILTRAALIGMLGALAVVIGSLFLKLQQAAWVVLGLVYAGIGILYVTGRLSTIAIQIGPRLSRLAGAKGSALLGILFGLNIPVCAAPLLFILLGSAAAGGASGASMLKGFVGLSLFGLALSLPLALGVLIPSVRNLLDRLAGLSRRLPAITGLIMIALGLWSMWFGLFVTIRP